MPEDFQPGFEIEFNVSNGADLFDFIPEKSGREK